MSINLTQKEWNQLVENPSPVELIKDKSDYLRGSIEESLKDESTGSVHEEDQQLIKFHGFYQQDDRDRRNERQKKKLEPYYSFMLRVRIPAGVLTPGQWLKLDDISDRYANHTLKITTRQAIQFHGLIKFELKKTIQALDQDALDSIAACGDVNRNVMCGANPALIDRNQEVWKTADEISLNLLPKTRAYHEIWLEQGKGKKKITPDLKEEAEPLYGKHYLPRKFKIAIAVPPYNDTDVFSNDIGLIACLKDGTLQGFNVSVGGGLGMTFGMPHTFPRLADVIGYCPKEKIHDAVYHIVGIQRDFGNRHDRKLSRLKYTMEAMGLEEFKKELSRRIGFSLSKPKKFELKSNGDQYGWLKDQTGNLNLTLFVEGGRVKDQEKSRLKSALKEICEQSVCEIALTGNQNLILTKVKSENQKLIEKILEKHQVFWSGKEWSGLRKNSIACVALNTCPLAMAEAERYLPSLIDKIDPLLKKYRLTEENITIRMTGCPNGCGRPYLGEIAFIGKSLGHYNMYLGAAFNGERLNKLYRENINEETILNELDGLFSDFSENRKEEEHFGDFCIRNQYVKAVENGRDFHS